MQVYLRLVGLTLLARLRAAGTLPWVLFVGWLAFTSLQEPLLLRRYGIHLLDDAAWVGGVFVLASLLLAPGREPRRFVGSCDFATLLLVAGVQQLGVALVDRAPGLPDLHTLAEQGVLFVLAWMPLSLTLSRSRRWPSPGSFAAWCVAGSASLVGILFSVTLRGDPSPLAIAGAVLASATVAVIRPKPL